MSHSNTCRVDYARKKKRKITRERKHSEGYIKHPGNVPDRTIIPQSANKWIRVNCSWKDDRDGQIVIFCWSHSALESTADRRRPRCRQQRRRIREPGQQSTYIAELSFRDVPTARPHRRTDSRIRHSPSSSLEHSLGSMVGPQDRAALRLQEQRRGVDRQRFAPNCYPPGRKRRGQPWEWCGRRVYRERKRLVRKKLG